MPSSTSKILSVCIPTVDREHLLKDCLDSFLSEAEALGVRVLVTNNASRDGTADFLERLKRHNPVVTVNHLPSRLSIDLSHCEAVSNADTDYVLLLGDDDRLTPGALGRVLDYICRSSERGAEIDLLMLNPPRLQTRRLERFHEQEPKSPNSCSSLAAFAALWDKMPFGSFAVKRDAMSETSLRRYLRTSHAYSGGVWDFLVQQEEKNGHVRVELAREANVVFGQAEKTWHSQRTQIYFDDIPRWFCLLPAQLSSASMQAFVDYERSQTRCSSLARIKVYGDINALARFANNFSPRFTSRVRKVSEAPQWICKLYLVPYNLALSLRTRLRRWSDLRPFGSVKWFARIQGP